MLNMSFLMVKPLFSVGFFHLKPCVGCQEHSTATGGGSGVNRVAVLGELELRRPKIDETWGNRKP